MGKRRTPVRRPVKPNPPIRPNPPLRRTRRHQAIRALTKQIIAREQAGNRSDAEARVDVGGMLLEVREQLDHGEWLAWLAEDVPYGPRTAQRAIALHEWAQDHPSLFKRLAPLGPSKLYVLTTLPVAKLTRIAKAARVRIPGTSLRIPLDHLSLSQAIQLVHPSHSLPNELERRRYVERISRRIRRIANTSADLDVDAIPRDTAAAWHASLLEAAATIAERFDLE